MKWTSLRDIANSRIIKASYIWLFVVPILARILGSMDDVLEFVIFEASIKVSALLPFSWQMLFVAACFFSISNIIYSLFCPSLIKLYSDYSQFEAHGKSRLQINQALKAVSWGPSKPQVKPNFVDILSAYFKFYKDGIERNSQDLNEQSLKLFDDIRDIKGKNSDAFYFAYTASDTCNKPAIIASAICYIVGFGFIGVVALQNIYFVGKTVLL